MIDILFLLFIFALGAIVGSFLNVLVLRLNTGEQITRGRSRCFSCGHTLYAGDLIPLVSFFLYTGHCRYCKSKFSWQYPVVEFITGNIFLLIYTTVAYREPVYLSTHHLLMLIYYFFVFSLLIAVAVYDIRHKIIPNEFIYPFILLSIFAPFVGSSSDTLFLHSVAGFVGFLFFGSLWFFSKGRWMGFGDAKLALGIGFLLGPAQTIFAIMLSFWIGTIIMLPLLVRKKISLKAEIPFAPFLIAGTFVSWRWGELFISYVYLSV